MPPLFRLTTLLDMTPTPLVAEESSQLLHTSLPALMAQRPSELLQHPLRGPPVALAPPGTSALDFRESRGSSAPADTIAGSAISSEVAGSLREKACWLPLKLSKRAMWREIQPSLTEDNFLWRPISLRSECQAQPNIPPNHCDLGENRSLNQQRLLIMSLYGSTDPKRVLRSRIKCSVDRARMGHRFKQFAPRSIWR